MVSKYDKTRSAVVVCAGMIIDYWRRGDFDPEPSLLAMLRELAVEVDAHRAATAEMQKSRNGASQNGETQHNQIIQERPAARSGIETCDLTSKASQSSCSLQTDTATLSIRLRSR